MLYMTSPQSVVCWRWLCSLLCYVFVYGVHNISPKCCVLAVALFIYYCVWGYRYKVCGDECATCEATSPTIVLHAYV